MSWTRGQRSRGWSPVHWATVAALLTMGCGGGGDSLDSVFLYFFNAYPGASAMTAFGSQGNLINGVPYGSRLPDDGTVVTYDRTQGTEILVQFDGLQESVDASKELYEMYPGETGTFVLKRRSGVGAIETILYRHLQRIGPNQSGRDCTGLLGNALSTNNGFTGTDPYNLTLQYRVEPTTASAFRGRPMDMSAVLGVANRFEGYFDDDAGFIETQCGPIENPFPRQGLFEFLTQQQWMYLVEYRGEDSDTEVTLNYGVPASSQGDVRIIPPTFDYLDCLAGALTPKQPDPPPMVEANAGANCPMGREPVLDDYDIDFSVIAECQENTEIVAPIRIEVGGSDDYTLLFGIPTDWITAGQTTCTFTRRYRGFLDGVFYGDHRQDGNEFVDTTINHQPGDVHYSFVYGRPVNPSLFQWTTTGNYIPIDGNADPDTIGDRNDNGDQNVVNQ